MGEVIFPVMLNLDSVRRRSSIMEYGRFSSLEYPFYSFLLLHVRGRGSRDELEEVFAKEACCPQSVSHRDHGRRAV